MMRSTFAGFTTATLALRASQRALDVTGQNIANINTTGYTRQRLDIASLNNNRGDFYNSNPNIRIGFGVEITGLSQLRDPFLDIQYRTQIAKLGTTDAQVNGFEKLADIFDETTKEGIKDAFLNLNTQLQNLSKSPNSREYDSMVRSASQILLNLFHQSATDLKAVRDDLTKAFQDTDVKDMNQLMQNIAELNKNIKNAHILGNPALELQDQRNELIDELASYLPITVNYRDHEVGPGVLVQVLDIQFTDSNGQRYTLISDGNAGELQADISGQPVTLSLIDASQTQTADITDSIPNGVLKGTLDMLNKSGDFDGSDVKGIGYYEKTLDAMVKKFADVFNDLNKGYRIGADGKAELDPATGQPILEDRPLFEASGAGDITAANIKIADNWQNGTYGITASTVITNGEIGDTANENILNMIKALDESRSFEADGVSFYKGGFYGCFVNMENVLAIDQKAGNTMLTNQITVLNQTSNSRDSVSGVSLDEEGISLMHYQQSYSAAARFMTTLDEALNTLINNTGLVGR